MPLIGGAFTSFFSSLTSRNSRRPELSTLRLGCRAAAYNHRPMPPSPVKPIGAASDRRPTANGNGDDGRRLMASIDSRELRIPQRTVEEIVT